MYRSGYLMNTLFSWAKYIKYSVFMPLCLYELNTICNTTRRATPSSKSSTTLRALSAALPPSPSSPSSSGSPAPSRPSPPRHGNCTPLPATTRCPSAPFSRVFMARDWTFRSTRSWPRSPLRACCLSSTSDRPSQSTRSFGWRDRPC